MDVPKFVEDLREILKLLSEVVIVLSPIVVGIYWRVRKTYGEQIDKMKKDDKEKAERELRSFSHALSISSMRSLKEICNIYVDKTSASNVLYFQLENGTMADSLLQNMFLSCMAESDRYSNLPKWMQKVQRLPVQSVISYIEYINRIDFDSAVAGESEIDPAVQETLFPSNISAWRIHAVRNRDGYIIGYVVFEYLFDPSISQEDLNHFNSDTNPLINECCAAIESELIQYQNKIEAKKNELKL